MSSINIVDCIQRRGRSDGQNACLVECKFGDRLHIKTDMKKNAGTATSSEGAEKANVLLSEQEMVGNRNALLGLKNVSNSILGRWLC